MALVDFSQFMAGMPDFEQRRRQTVQDYSGFGTAGMAAYDEFRRRKAQELLQDSLKAWDLEYEPADKWDQEAAIQQQLEAAREERRAQLAARSQQGMGGKEKLAIRDLNARGMLNPMEVKAPTVGQEFERLKAPTVGQEFERLKAISMDPNLSVEERKAAGAEALVLGKQIEDGVFTADDTTTLPEGLEGVDELAAPRAAREAVIGQGLPVPELSEADEEEIRKIAEDRAAQAYDDLFREGPVSKAEYQRLRRIMPTGLSDAQRYRRVAEMLAPWDPRKSDEMLKYAEERERFEQEQAAKTAQDPAKNMRNRLENARVAYGIAQNAASMAAQAINNAPEGEKEAYLKAYNEAKDQMAVAKKEFDTAYSSMYPKLEEGPTVDAKKVPEVPTADGVVDEEVPSTAQKAAKDMDTVKAAVNSGSISRLGSRAEFDKWLSNNAINNPDAIDEAERVYQRSPAGRKEAKVAAAKKAESEAWNTLTTSNAYRVAKREYNQVDEARKYLAANLNSSIKLDRATIAQIKYQIARAVTGPGVLTEKEVDATNTPESKVASILSEAGLLSYFDDLNEDSVRAGMKAALGNKSGINSAARNFNDLIIEHNRKHKGYERPKSLLLGVQDYGSGGKTSKKVGKFTIRVKE